MLVHSEIMKCRSCGSSRLYNFWTAGVQYIVGFPKTMAITTLPQAPLTLAVCESCWLVQLRHTVDKDMLFHDFWYRSGMNEMMREALRDVVESTLTCVDLRKNDTVVDIGCNDGTLFSGYGDRDVVKVGFDPAKNIQSPGFQKTHGGWRFECDYFSAQRFLKNNQRAKIVTACAMFYDLENPTEFLKDVKKILHEDGVFVIQMNYLPAMLERHCIDNVSHEHLMYYSLGSLNDVVHRAGLEVFHTEINFVNGGSLRAYICHSKKRAPTEEAISLLASEKENGGLESLSTYEQFAGRVGVILEDLDKLLVELAEKSEVVYAYGASTRGTALLQMLKNTHLIRGVAERDASKWTRFMVGSWLPIVPEEEAREQATVFFVLPYHFLSAIIQRERQWIVGGGKLLVPVPKPELLRHEKVLEELELHEEPK
jgi:SAM-dependent methyltransferase